MKAWTAVWAEEVNADLWRASAACFDQANIGKHVLVDFFVKFKIFAPKTNHISKFNMKLRMI